MELAQLLESEGLDADELMDWAWRRAGQLIEELAADEPGHELLALLEANAAIDVTAIEVARVRPVAAPGPAIGETQTEVADEFEEPEFGGPEPEGAVEAAVEEPVADAFEESEFDEPEFAEASVSQAGPKPKPDVGGFDIDIDDDFDDAFDDEASAPGLEPELDDDLDASEAERDPDAPGLRRRSPSTPQPTSADELPPLPENPGYTTGAPEPLLETVDTSPIDLGSPEAEALLDAHSTQAPAEPEAHAEAEAEAEADEAGDDAGDGEDEEFEEFEELELEEFEEFEIIDEEPEAAPPAPPPPPPPPPPPSSSDDAQTADAAADSADEDDGEGDSAGEDDAFDIDLD